MKFTNHIKSTVQLYICKAKYQFYAFLTYVFKGHPYFASKKLKIGSILIAVTLAMCNYQQKSPIQTQNKQPKDSNLSKKETLKITKDSTNKKKLPLTENVDTISCYVRAGIDIIIPEITCYSPVIFEEGTVLEKIIPDDTIPFVKLTCDSLKGEDSTKVENSK
jgi:hypothetical protein